MDLSNITRRAESHLPKDETQRKALMRYVRIGGIALGVLILILIILPFFINVDSFRPEIQAKASAALGRQVTLGHLSLSILSGRVGVDHITIADDPAFSNSPFVTAESLKIGVELMPLIFSKKLNVTDIALEKPEINLLKSAAGKWNFSSIGGAAAQKESTPSAPESFSVGKLSVDDGRVSMGKANSSAKPTVYDDVEIAIKDFSFASQFPVKASAKLPGGGDADISANVGPINSSDSSRTPVDATLKVNDLNIAAMEIVDPSEGVAGIANLDGTLNSDGHHAKLAGTLTGKQLKLSPKGTPAPKAVTVKYAMDSDLEQQLGTITQGDISVGSALAHLTGTLHSQGEAEVVNLKLNAPDLPVDEVESMLPCLGIVLPSGSQLKGGTLSGDLDIAGPLDKLVITGPVKLSNTKLANFDLGAKLGALSNFMGKATSSRDTAIENASLNGRVAPEGTTANNINVTVPALGVLTGAGTVSPAGALAFKMMADLHGGVVGGLTKVAGLGSGSSGIPFSIEGTTSNPKFVPDVTGVAAGLAKQELGNLAKGKAGSQGLAKGLGGLFHK